MSLEAITRALHHSKAPSTAKLILIAIANHQGSRAAYPSLETLAEYANVSKRTAQYAIRELQQLGELIIDERRGRNFTNSYIVAVRCPEDCDETLAHRVIKGAISDTKTCNIRQEKVQPIASKPLRTNINPREKSKEEIMLERMTRQEHARRIIDESTRAKAEAVDSPQCIHGKTLIKCIECCKALNI